MPNRIFVGYFFIFHLILTPKLIKKLSQTSISGSVLLRSIEAARNGIPYDDILMLKGSTYLFGLIGCRYALFLFVFGLCTMPSRPSIEMSSSSKGQCMPYPDGEISNSFSSASFASANKGEISFIGR